MANNEPSDSRWFYNILGDNESNLNENSSKDDENSDDQFDNDLFNSENIRNLDNAQLRKESNYVQNGSLNQNSNTIMDEIKLKSDLEKSLYDLAVESVKKGQTPGFRITISPNDEETTEKKVKEDDFERILFSNIDQSKEDNEISKSFESSEKTFDIGTTENQLTENSNTNTKPKIYVILKSNENSENKNIAESGGTLNKNEEVCSNIGSTVINLNDFISTESNPVTGNENITTSVNFLGNDDEKQKVELVITIKDERNKPSDEPATANSYKVENNTDFPSMDSLLNEELFTSQIKRFSERTKKLLSTSNALIHEDPYKEFRQRNSQDTWPDSKDTYFRESDGARCVRTVKNTPWGRRVQTQCFKEDHPGSRRRNYGRTSGCSCFFDDLENDFERMFNGINRLMFF